MRSPAEQFDRYVIESLIGEGGMGRVYRARDSKLRRLVALKVLRAEGSANAAEHLLNEARAAAALDHASAISIFDVGEVEGVPFIAMELVDGRSLRDAIGDASVGLDVRVRYLVDIARALDAAHQRGILHRDVKPENVIVRRDGVVKVLDFGIARSLAAADSLPPSLPVHERAAHVVETLTRSGLVGTPRYMAPEQLRGEPVDARADQFAWGVLAYELLSGRSPWDDDGSSVVSLTLVSSIVDDGSAPEEALRQVVPRAVADIVLRALAKKADDRHPSMAAIASALEATPSQGRRRPGAPLPGVTDRGEPVATVIAGFGSFHAIAAKYVGAYLSPDGSMKPDTWVPLQNWLDCYGAIVEEVGPGVLTSVGQTVPSHGMWPEMHDIDSAMERLNLAYHANHRLDGVLMYDPASGAIIDAIGNYAATREDGARRVTMRSDVPYPCELDLGIIGALAQLYEPQAKIVHAPLGCRTFGARACTYIVTW